jgi:hypothetical protein
MGFRISSFLGGVASGANKAIEDEEKNAKQFGILAAKDMLERFDKMKEENDLEIAKKVELVQTLRAYNEGFTETELRDIVANPATANTIEQLAKTGKLNEVDWKSLVKGKVAGVPEAPGTPTAEEQIKTGLAIPTGMGLKTQYKERTGFMGVFGESTYDKTIEQAAQARGITKEQLLATREYKKPELKAGQSQFNFDALTPVDIDKQISRTESEYTKLLNNAGPGGPDQNAINVTRDKLYKLKETKALGDPSAALGVSSQQLAYAKQAIQGNEEDFEAAYAKASPEDKKRYDLAVIKQSISTEAVANATADKAKSYEQINNSLINKITALRDNPKATPQDHQMADALESRLRARQELHKGAGTGSDDALKAGQLTTEAKGYYNTTLINYLGRGNYTIDPQTGNVLATGGDSARAARATQLAYQHMIERFSIKEGANKGKVLSPAHESALSSIGIDVINGVARVPSIVGGGAAQATSAATSLPAVAAGASPTRAQPSPSGMQISPDTQKARDVDRTKIIQTELESVKNQLATATDPKVKQRLQGDVDALTRELGGKSEPVKPTAVLDTTKPSLGAPAPASQPKKQEPEKMPVNRDGSAYIGGMKKNVPYVDKDGRVSYIDDNGKRQFIR